MSAGRHRKTLPWQVRLQRWGALTAPLLAAAAVVPVAAALEPAHGLGRTSTAAPLPGVTAERAAARTVSRTAVRPDPPGARMADVVALELATEPAALELSPRWVEDDLKAWRDSAQGTRLLTVLGAGDKVQFTGIVHGTWAQIVRGDALAWVHKEYLARTRPAPDGGSAVNSGVSGAACPDGSSVESGLQPDTVKVYRSVCAAFPAVSSWGGRTGSGDHGAGLALDIMCSGPLGDAIAAYVRAHASELGVSEVIWSQRIWTVQRGSEGWRPMEDRGSSTANHYDHVHVSVY